MTPAPIFTKPVAVGDRITINSGGRERVLHVVNVDKLDSSIVLTSSERPARLLLVTCRDQANPKARPVRFLIEADESSRPCPRPRPPAPSRPRSASPPAPRLNDARPAVVARRSRCCLCHTFP